jgi:hypothetical protein
MGKSTRGTPKKKRGRPSTTGRGTQIGMRWQDKELAVIDDWRKSHDVGSRAEAIRHLVALGLGGHSELPKKTEKHSQDETTGKRAK